MIKVGENREVKFDKGLRLPRQDNFDIAGYELIESDLFEGYDRIYKNFNFSIFIDDYCNADCKFCVAQLRFQHRNEIYKKQRIESTKEYLNRLEKVLDMLRPLNPSISITGGEPSLSPKLEGVLKLVDGFGFRKRTMTTNGSGLLKQRFGGASVLDLLLRYGWNHLNISRASIDDEVNRQIMRFAGDTAFCDIRELREVLLYLEGTDLKHRLSCLLLKECVSSVEDIKNYVDFYEEIGANNFIFRELMDYSRQAINTEKIAYCDENKVKLNDIWSDFEQFPEFKPYLNLLGYYYYVEIYKYRNSVVASESADLNQQYKEKSKNPHVIYEMVFHPNGNLNASWVDKEEILMKYDAGKMAVMQY